MRVYRTVYSVTEIFPLAQLHSRLHTMDALLGDPVRHKFVGVQKEPGRLTNTYTGTVHIDCRLRARELNSVAAGHLFQAWLRWQDTTDRF